MLFYVFDVGQTDKLKSDTRRHRPTPETQDGGRQTGSVGILRFRCRSMSAGVRMVFIGLADIENIEIAFRISFLSIIEREIQVLPVWRPPSCVSGVGRCRDVIRYSGLRFGEVCQS
jgi:hypothetical protein